MSNPKYRSPYAILKGYGRVKEYKLTDAELEKKKDLQSSKKDS